MIREDRSAPPAQWMDILQMRPDWESDRTIARVAFDGERIALQGDPAFLERLEQGVPDDAGGTVLPSDGVRFLTAAKAYFANPPHVYCSEITSDPQIPHVPAAWTAFTSS